MPRTRRKGKTQPLYIATGRALARGWERFAGIMAGFWRDLTQARGSRYYRALAVFCALCMVVGAGTSLAWRTASVQAAVSHYRAVFLGTGGQTVAESPPLPPTGQASPTATGEEPPAGGGTAETPATSGPDGQTGGSSTPDSGGGAAESSRPDLSTLGRPLAGAVVLDFGWQYSATLADWRFHPGVDLQATEGTPVRAALAGKVTEVAEDFEYGLVVRVDHGGGVSTVYGQLAKSTVSAGQAVTKGQQLGTVGAPAGVELDIGPHLHFELTDGENALDPQEYWK